MGAAVTIGTWIITLFALGAVAVCVASYFATGWGLAAGILIIVGSLGLAACTDVDDTDRAWPERRR